MAIEQNTPDYSDLNTPDNFNPFDEPVHEREYTKPNVSYDPNQIQSIPEPSYQQPNLDQLQDEDYEDEPPKEKPKYGHGSDDPFVNRDLEDYDKGASNDAAESLVDTFLEGYKVLHTFGQRYFSIGEEELVKKIIKGDINPDMRIPVSETQTLSVQEYIGEYNRQVTEVLVVEDDFIQRVKPVMIRVFAKRGYGMSDEQYLLFAFGKDLATKGAQIYTFKKSLTQSLKMMTEMWNSQNKPGFNAGAPPPPNQPPPNQPPPNQPPPPPQSDPVEPSPEPINEEPTQSDPFIEPEVVPTEIIQQTMHEDMEDEITPQIVKRRGRPSKKNIKLEPTEMDVEKKEINIDLNKGFDMEDAEEPEERG